MNLESWFYATFQGDRRNFPYPAVYQRHPISKTGVTYVFTRLSKLDALRASIKEFPPEPPITPVVAIDCGMDNPPKGTWIGLSSKDIHWYEGSQKKESFKLDLDFFNETMAAMTALYDLQKTS
jgi:hypothetical protein